MKNTIGYRIRERRRELKLSQEQLADAVGRTKGAVSQWESDMTQPRGDVTFKLSEALQCSAKWLIDGSEPKSQRPGRPNPDIAQAPAMQGYAPLVSWVQAGQWAEVCDIDLDPESVEWYPRPPGASESTFVLRVVGESMLPEYPPGRLIFVDPERAPSSNDDVIAVLTCDNEATFKRLIEEPGTKRLLKALNPAWKDPYMEINGDCRIVGVVVADMRIR